MLAQRFLDVQASAVSLGDGGDRWPEPRHAAFGCVREADPIAFLDDVGLLSGRFRSWLGRSGRRYVFSVFDAASCPAYCEAALIAVSVDGEGRRVARAFRDTGSFPEPVMSELTRDGSGPGLELEFHVHLLARTPAERRALLEDLRPLI